jgi:hypothetical protein
MEGKPPGKAKAKRPVGRPFQPGQSGNPGGRPKGLAAYVRECTRDNQEQADFFLRVARSLDNETPEEARYPAVTFEQVVEAQKWLADRGSGKPAQTLGLEGAGGEALEFSVRILPEAKR